MIGTITTQKKNQDRLYRRAILVLYIVTSISITAIAFTFQIINLQDQINNLHSPNLAPIGMQYSDNGKGVIHISGYVYNSGTEPAYESVLQVNLLNDNAVTNTTYLALGGANTADVVGSKIDGKTAFFVSVDINYTGSRPTNVTFATQWISELQIPVA